jgi:hypothetical protein
MMRTRLLFLAALALLVLSGCSASEAGHAQPAQSVGKRERHSPEPGSGVPEPCALLNATKDLASYGTFRGPEVAELGGARSCSWKLIRKNPADEGLVVSLDVRDEQSIGSMNDDGGGIQTGDVNGRSASRAPNPETGDCTMGLALTQHSRIDVGISSISDVDKSCRIAQEVAYIVEPRLPDA